MFGWGLGNNTNAQQQREHAHGNVSALPIHSLSLCACATVDMCACVYMWGCVCYCGQAVEIGGQLLEVLSSLHRFCLGLGCRSAGLCGKGFYLLSHLAGPFSTFHSKPKLLQEEDSCFSLLYVYS